MFDIQLFLAILSGKLINFSLNFANSGGTAAPGLISLKIDSRLIKKLRKQLTYSIIISGTNGKTTTARLLASILQQAGIAFYHNRAGSNLLRGVASTLVSQAKLNGSLVPKIGLWEIDEAALPQALESLQPKLVVLTNLFRDQLDRYGEIDTLAKKWQLALKKLPQQNLIILNSDDPTVASLGKNLSHKVYYYGIRDSKAGEEKLSHAADAIFCPYCSRALVYKKVYISHLGRYYCRNCGEIQPNPQFFADHISHQLSQLQFLSHTPKVSYLIKAPLSGLYNTYNALASISIATLLKIDKLAIIEGIKKFIPAFGRFEQISIGQKTLKILLVKNPAGFNEVIKMINFLTHKQKASLLIALNDKIADGQDVSWIWDADVEKLEQEQLANIIISGTRRYDLGLRLKYANIIRQPADRISNILPLNQAISSLLNTPSKNLIIIPTYTAMLEIRKILNKKGLVHSTWKD